jgi:hypothetical protein
LPIDGEMSTRNIVTVYCIDEVSWEFRAFGVDIPLLVLLALWDVSGVRRGVDALDSLVHVIVGPDIYFLLWSENSRRYRITSKCVLRY